MRVFIPATATLLGRWAEAGAVTGIAAAHAATPALRDWLGDEADTEELEYVAIGEAAEACVRLLADDPASAPHRIVLAADVELLLAPDAGEAPYSLVRPPEPVSMDSVVSVMVDDDDATASVVAAVQSIRDRRPAPEQEHLMDEASAHELMWFDVTEVPQVLGLVGGH